MELDIGYLAEVVSAAIEAGAKTVKAQSLRLDFNKEAKHNIASMLELVGAKAQIEGSNNSSPE